MKKILIYGVGQLGSRYIQGLAKSQNCYEIIAVDPSGNSLREAKLRWSEVDGEKSSHTIRWLEKYPENLDAVDLVIVVTSSLGRAELIRNLSEKLQVRYWILEKLLTQSVDELKIIEKATASADARWVNTPRRLMDWHRKLKSRFFDKAPLRVTKSGGLWGLACNSIHFIDLTAWWTGESLVSMNTSGLDNVWFESKRPGFYETTGELIATFSGGSVLSLNASFDAAEQELRVETVDGEVWEIDEQRGVAFAPGGQLLPGQIEYQSSMTAPLVTGILQKNTCSLPTLAESSAQHAVFLEAMLKHWNRSQNLSDRRVRPCSLSRPPPSCRDRHQIG